MLSETFLTLVDVKKKTSDNFKANSSMKKFLLESASFGLEKCLLHFFDLTDFIIEFSFIKRGDLKLSTYVKLVDEFFIKNIEFKCTNISTMT